MKWHINYYIFTFPSKRTSINENTWEGAVVQLTGKRFSYCGNEQSINDNTWEGTVVQLTRKRFSYCGYSKVQSLCLSYNFATSAKILIKKNENTFFFLLPFNLIWEFTFSLSTILRDYSDNVDTKIQLASP